MFGEGRFGGPLRANDPANVPNVVQSALNVQNEASMFVLLQNSWHAHIGPVHTGFIER